MKITISCNEFSFKSDRPKDKAFTKDDLLAVIGDRLNTPWWEISNLYPNFPTTALWVISDCNISRDMKMKALTELFIPFGVELEFTDTPEFNYN